MDSRTWSVKHHRLLLVGGTGLVEGNRIGVAPGDLPDGGRPGLLRLGANRERTTGVRLVPAAGLPSGLVAVSEEFAGQLGLAEGATEPWELTLSPATVAAAVTLEPLTDGSLDRTAQELRRAGDVCGQVFWWDSTPGATTWLHAAGAPLRVRQMAGPDGSPATGLVEIGPQTELTLFGQGNRTGVDIVVLADCSGSMSLQDVPDLADAQPRRGLFGWGGGQARYIRRSEALRRALHRMVDARLRVAGRVSRIALVQFGNECHSLFPRGGGMAEMGADTDIAVVEEFRHAIGQLVPRRDGTDIGNALHFASELLFRHGVPNNETLIVLVSDGAHLPARGEDTTGETVPVYEDPVSMMDELHQGGIRLHALGISDESTFHAWWRKTYPGEAPDLSSIPNHRLLGELVAVGGGDPTRIGGLDVLERYFGGLGTGVTRAVGTPAPPAPPPVQPELAEAVRRAGQLEFTVRAEIEHRADRLRNLYTSCHDACRRRRIDEVFQPPGRYNDLATLGSPALSRKDFLDWIQAVNKVFIERIHPGLHHQWNAKKDAPYALPEVRDLVRDGRLDKLRWLRNDLSHDAHGGPDQAKIGAIYAEFTGLYALTDDDARNWARLQLGCTRLLGDLLTELNALLSRATVEPEQEPAEQSADAEEATTFVGWTVTARGGR